MVIKNTVIPINCRNSDIFNYSLDTHPAFSHTLPSKIIETNRIRKSIAKAFASPAAAGPRLQEDTIYFQIMKRRFKYAFDFIGWTRSRERDPG
jgi:hypothetical protein